MLGTPESERLKVTALNLFHPTASPPFKKWVFSYYDTTSSRGGLGWGWVLFRRRITLALLDSIFSIC